MRIEKEKTTATVVNMTPSGASKLLARSGGTNFRNRNVNLDRVARYVEEIKRGRWALNGETIVIGTGGEVLNGQHRLMAIVKAGVAVKVTVVSGIDPETFATMDQGKPRTAGDVLGALGNVSAHHLASALRLLYFYQKYSAKGMRLALQGGARTVFSNEMAVEMLDKHPGIMDFVTFSGGALSRIVPRSVGIFCHYIMAEIDPELAHEYMIGIRDGANLKQGSPIYAVRERILRERARASAPLRQEFYIYLLFRGWNGWIGGKKMERIEVPSTIEFPELVKG